uniref:Tubby C-terminal domain-containing protein n=1 Tax=Eutreptiella gymnastica TaxID=73025 RepID=A0A7S1HWN6_9EUGL|mmetsp:Transcript_110627/g.191770  ORF Transcript_110627/g.191770 Transcript_110627/m.191770 type:complete len:210 (+) Transcript_110627:71-700(+)
MGCGASKEEEQPLASVPAGFGVFDPKFQVPQGRSTCVEVSQSWWAWGPDFCVRDPKTMAKKFTCVLKDNEFGPKSEHVCCGADQEPVFIMRKCDSMANREAKIFSAKDPTTELFKVLHRFGDGPVTEGLKDRTGKETNLALEVNWNNRKATLWMGETPWHANVNDRRAIARMQTEDSGEPLQVDVAGGVDTALVMAVLCGYQHCSNAED